MSLPVIFILGPTAIGKSDFAIKLAKKLNGEIINADSMQVYSELSIITARPTSKDIKILPHHLYGHVSGSQRYNVARWCKESTEVINQNKKNKIHSIVVGGTGLYVDKLINGIADIPYINEKDKKKTNDLFKKIGMQKFYERVYQVDKNSCKKISKNDTQRLKRIWEVFQSTGIPLSQWIDKKHIKKFKNINFKIFLFLPNRNEVYRNVDKRFIRMINGGALEEVKNLIKMKFDKTLPIMRAHGVPEICNYLAGSSNLEECIKFGQQVTRNYVKRQFTWWNSSKIRIHKVFNEFPGNIDVKSIDI